MRIDPLMAVELMRVREMEIRHTAEARRRRTHEPPEPVGRQPIPPPPRPHLATVPNCSVW